jgi:hypothetical protein
MRHSLSVVKDHHRALKNGGTQNIITYIMNFVKMLTYLGHEKQQSLRNKRDTKPITFEKILQN